MKLSPELEVAFNNQVTLEFEASMVYRQLAIELDSRDLPGMGAWLRHQADEEIVHANKFIDHLIDRDNHAQIGKINSPQLDVSTPLDAFKAAYAHEQRVSEAIRSLYRTTEEAGDLDSRPLLNWFLNEQIEEEATVSEIVAQLELVGEDGPGLLRVDAELASRPTGTTEA
ncbi:MAG TPA: ferritin [Candidatus Avipropionibacterium avicola]|uniref:Ferritin n=1 Tax=Candidatus Avipropionibacterium avicola TaxID=2840701 RepID=A0A9D1GXD8_9ACTN|nr:ferritin [Candidatus Avipropionibacterium avicola]